MIDNKVKIRVKKKINELKFNISKKNYKAAMQMLFVNYKKIKQKIESINIINMEDEDQKLYNKATDIINKFEASFSEHKDNIINMKYDNAKNFIKNFISVLFYLDRVFIKLYAKYIDSDIIVNKVNDDGTTISSDDPFSETIEKLINNKNEDINYG